MADPTKLVRWLPQIARATADDIALFGRGAPRMRALLDFLPTMSDEAAEVAEIIQRSGTELPRAANSAWGSAIREGDANAFQIALEAAVKSGSRNPHSSFFAAQGEMASNLIRPQEYAELTSPLATGRAFDVLRPRAPENFLDVVRGLGERGGIQRPADVLSARRISQVEDELARSEIVDLILNYGMSPEEAIIAVRALG